MVQTIELHLQSEIKREKMSNQATPTWRHLSNDDKLAIIEASKSPGFNREEVKYQYQVKTQGIPGKFQEFKKNSRNSKNSSIFREKLKEIKKLKRFCQLQLVFIAEKRPMNKPALVFVLYLHYTLFSVVSRALVGHTRRRLE